MSGCQTRSTDEGLGQRVRQYRQMGSVVFSPSSLSLTGPVQMKNVCVYVCACAGVHVRVWLARFCFVLVHVAPALTHTFRFSVQEGQKKGKG